MNNKITFPKLASLLADKSGRSKRFSEDFLRELFAIISEKLEAGESVKVKGLGTFRLMRVEPRKSVDVTTGLPMEISGHSKVVFTPAKELADAINAPFEAFTPIEIGDDIDLDKVADEADVEVSDDSEEIVLSAGDQLLQAESNPAETILEPEHIPAEPIIDKELIVAESVTEETPIARVNILHPENEDDDITILDGGFRYDEYSMHQEYTSHGKSTPTWVRTILISAACAALAVVATFLIWSILTRPDFKNVDRNSEYLAEFDHSNADEDSDGFENDENASSVFDIEVPSVEESVSAIGEDVPTAPSDALVYDTIGTSRFLTTMAKNHYGNNKFWPYIYEENKSRIGHPDKIRPGTPIVIPKLSKYGVDPSNPDDEAKANKLGAEIYARYGKTI